MAMLEKIDPNVQRLISPIMQRMTSINIAERMNPVIGDNSNDRYKNEKRECVHFIFDNGTPACMLAKTDDGKLKCKACGREVYCKFDDSAIQRLIDARAVIEQIMWFGMVNGLQPDIVSACIDMKKMLPDLAKVLKDLNEYVRREESNLDAVQNQNIGSEYRFNGFTSAY